MRSLYFTDAEIRAWLPELGRRRTPGTARIRRVLALRPVGAPPTGSLLETLFVQLRRRVHGSAEPTRQVEVRNVHGEFVAFVDFAWPDLGLFIELDGLHHEGQPVHDARRETRGRRGDRMARRKVHVGRARPPSRRDRAAPRSAPGAGRAAGIARGLRRGFVKRSGCWGRLGEAFWSPKRFTKSWGAGGGAVRRRGSA